MYTPLIDPAFTGEHHKDCYSALYAHPTDHEPQWTGWPGASCMVCGREDVSELCIADCQCPCHEAFWRGFEEAMKRKGDEDAEGRTESN